MTIESCQNENGIILRLFLRLFSLNVMVKILRYFKEMTESVSSWRISIVKGMTVSMSWCRLSNVKGVRVPILWWRLSNVKGVRVPILWWRLSTVKGVKVSILWWRLSTVKGVKVPILLWRLSNVMVMNNGKGMTVSKHGNNFYKGAANANAISWRIRYGIVE